MRRCQLAEGHTHRADGQDPCNFCGGEGPGTMGESVVRRGVPARLPVKVTWGRVVQLYSTPITVITELVQNIYMQLSHTHLHTCTLYLSLS